MKTPLSPALETLVSESVIRFMEKLGSFKAIAELNGWVEDYRQEIRRVIIEARKVS